MMHTSLSKIFGITLRVVRLTALVVGALALGASAQAADIVVGNHYLLPNTPNQLVTIQVTGAESIAGEDFYAQIGDGGAFNSGTNTNPVFSGVDIVGGSV